MYKISQTTRNVPKESLPELIGGLIAALILLAVYLAVPVLIIAACLRILGVI